MEKNLKTAATILACPLLAALGAMAAGGGTAAWVLAVCFSSALTALCFVLLPRFSGGKTRPAK